MESLTSLALALSLLTLLFRPGELQAAAFFDISTLKSEHNINDFSLALLDEEDRSMVEMDARLEAEGQAIPDLLWGGYRDGYYWVRLHLSNESSEPKTVHLITANRLTSHFKYFIPSPEQRSLVQIKRVRTSIPTLEMTLPPGLKLRLLMKLKFGLQDTVNFYARVPVVVTDEGAFSLNLQQLTFGIIIGLICFNLGLFLLTRQLVFLLHAIASGMVFWAVFLLSGMMYEYFKVDEWNRLLPVAGNLAVAANNAFGQAYLGTRDRHPRIHRFFAISMCVGILGALILLFGGSKKIVYFTDLNLLAIVCMGMTTIYIFPPSRYRIMRFYVIGWVGLAISALIWVASEYAILERSALTENAMTVGLSFELILVSLGLADQINHYKNTLSEYNRNLERTVEEKTRDIRSIMEYIPMGVFMIQRNNRIHKDHSRQLGEILNVKDFEQNPATDILFERFVCSSDDRSQATSVLVASLGEDPVNFEVNLHMLPLELRDEKERIWDLTWNAIQGQDGQVEKILVTMREVTEMRKLVERSRAQQAELELIGEIISVSPQRFQRFIRSARDMMDDNALLLSGLDSADRRDVLKNLFINAHTIKGSARSLYFKKITQLLHDMEQVYADLQKHPEKDWDLPRMKADVLAVKELLGRYETIAHDKLGRTMTQGRSIEFSLEQGELGYHTLTRAVQERILTPESLAALKQIRNFLHQHIFRSARDFFDEVADSLPALARDLQKEDPILELDVEGYHIKDQAEDVLRNIFLHLLRNSMDHGIEAPAERRERNKDPRGRIRIAMRKQATGMLVMFEDDGRGLNIARIRDMALERQQISSVEGADPRRVAELIFDVGLSTARHVTDISGRGVGMNAVRRFARMHEGDVTIQLGEENPEGSGYFRFQLHILLPSRYFEADERTDQQSVA